MRKREKYEAFLKKIQLLETMEDYERSQIAEGFQDVKYTAGQFIIR